MKHFKQHATNVIYLTVLYCTVLTTMFSSCSKENDDANTAELVDKVWEYSKKNPDGFTIEIQTFTPLTKGFAVSYKETQNSFEKDGLRRVISHALKHNNIVGGWLNSQNGYYYFDSVKLFEDAELDEAIRFAKENEQIAIYDLTNQKEILVSEYESFKTIIYREIHTTIEKNTISCIFSPVYNQLRSTN